MFRLDEVTRKMERRQNILFGQGVFELLAQLSCAIAVSLRWTARYFQVIVWQTRTRSDGFSATISQQRRIPAALQGRVELLLILILSCIL